MGFTYSCCSDDASYRENGRIRSFETIATRPFFPSSPMDNERQGSSVKRERGNCPKGSPAGDGEDEVEVDIRNIRNIRNKWLARTNLWEEKKSVSERGSAASLFR